MWDVIKTFGPTIIGVFVAASIARKWQHRNWLLQQRVSDVEKRYMELRSLYDDFVQISSARLYKMQRLLWALQSDDDLLLEERRKEYDEELVRWNEKTHTLIVRFMRNMQNGQKVYTEIYDTITLPFVSVGRQLEVAIRRRKKGEGSGLGPEAGAKLEVELQSVSSAIFESSRSIYKALQQFNDDRLDEEVIERERLRKGEYWSLSYSQLLRAIFKKDGRAVE